MKFYLADDACITFRYVENFLLGKGLVPCHNGPRLEGFSNPLLLFSTSAIAFLLRTTEFSELLKIGLWINIIAGFALCVLLSVWKRNEGSRFWYIPSILLAGSSVFQTEMLTGLETVLYAALLTLTSYCFFHTKIRWAMGFSFLVAMTRPEAGIAIFPLILIALVQSDNKASFKKNILFFLVFFLFPLSLFIGARLLYFEEWLPNTVIAKSHYADRGSYGGSEFTSLLNCEEKLFWKAIVVSEAMLRSSGVKYLCSAFYYHPKHGLFVIFYLFSIYRMIKAKKWKHLYVILPVIIQMCFIICVGGDDDFFGRFRFIVPILPLLLFYSDDLFKMLESFLASFYKSVFSRFDYKSSSAFIIWIVIVLCFFPSISIFGEEDYVVNIPYTQNIYWAFSEPEFLYRQVDTILNPQPWLDVYASEILKEYFPLEGQGLSLCSCQGGMLLYHLKVSFHDSEGLLSKSYARLSPKQRLKEFVYNPPDVNCMFLTSTMGYGNWNHRLEGFPGHFVMKRMGYTPVMKIIIYPPPVNYYGTLLTEYNEYSFLVFTFKPDLIKKINTNRVSTFQFVDEIISIPVIRVHAS